MIANGPAIAPKYEVEAVENLRRIVRRTFPTVPAVVSAARQALIEVEEVVHTCSIADLDAESKPRGAVHTHAVDKRGGFGTRCGRKWFGILSSSSWELIERIDCPSCIADIARERFERREAGSEF